MKFIERICWVSAVGDAPATGGGVARAVNLINQTGLIKINNGDLVSLYGLTKVEQIKLCVKMLLAGYRKFVLHSFFSPFSLFLLCLPVPVEIVLLPHGELRCGALALNAKRKRLFLFLVRLCFITNRYLKVIGGVATTDEELDVICHTLPAAGLYKVSDFVSVDMLMGSPNSIDPNAGVNLVNIARMVPNKGVVHLLEVMVAKLTSSSSGWTKLISGVYLFYVKESPAELAEVVRLSEQLRSLGVSVHLFEGLTPDQIRQTIWSVPNRLGFVSSRFESFSYALIESLGFEYRPIVWFKNDLVEQLIAKNLCQHWEYGCLDPAEHCSPLQRTIKLEVQYFIESLSADNKATYQHILSKIFGVVERNPELDTDRRSSTNHH